MSDQAFPEITALEKTDAIKVLESSEFRATPFNHENITHEHFKSAGLYPKCKFSIGEDTIFISDLYYILGKRVAATAFVQIGSNAPIVRSYYRSNSQGVWRYLADYTLKSGMFDWYEKGHEHGHLTACLALQKALGNIEQNPAAVKHVDRYDFIFAGTARERKESKPYYGSSGEPQPLLGNFYPDEGKRVPPEQLTFFNNKHTPSFDHRITAWTKKSGNYGTISVEIFASHDKTLQFMFCKDNEGRAWIATIENVLGTLASTGIKIPWIQAGDLTTPVYEYTTLSYGYADTQNRKGPYLDMFPHYLSKSPIIKQYLHYAGKEQDLRPK